VTGTDAALLCAHVATPLAGASVCVPLAAHGESLGLLHLCCPHGCEDEAGVEGEKPQLAEALAAQIGMALANLRMRESLQEQSIRDALTGLYNRRYLEGTLPRELARARRAGRPLAVFMLDVDHFKNFNDSHGHEAGDAVLKALGKTFRDNCRQSDFACRFGGEEFTLVLPEADESAAREWAARLLQRVRAMEVKAGGQTLPKVTVSIGLALLPTHGEDAETLLQAADLALYDAKHAGRDRLVVSGEVHD
ncbi:MAG: sensor domain-containing diguanylate cyclase, partial [Pseudomonadota bacterium]